MCEKANPVFHSQRRKERCQPCESWARGNAASRKTALLLQQSLLVIPHLDSALRRNLRCVCVYFEWYMNLYTKHTEKYSLEEVISPSPVGYRAFNQWYFCNISQVTKLAPWVMLWNAKAQFISKVNWFLARLWKRFTWHGRSNCSPLRTYCISLPKQWLITANALELMKCCMKEDCRKLSFLCSVLMLTLPCLWFPLANKTEMTMPICVMKLSVLCAAFITELQTISYLLQLHNVS